MGVPRDAPGYAGHLKFFLKIAQYQVKTLEGNRTTAALRRVAQRKQKTLLHLAAVQAATRISIAPFDRTLTRQVEKMSELCTYDTLH